jgi:hypothetical protein
MVFRTLLSATMAASQFAPRTKKPTESIITKFQNRKTQDTISREPLWLQNTCMLNVVKKTLNPTNFYFTKPQKH